MQVVVRLYERCDWLRVSNWKQQIDPKAIDEMLSELRRVHRNDRIEPPSGKGVREAKRRLQLIEPLRFNAPANADGPVADVQRKATHRAPLHSLGSSRG